MKHFYKVEETTDELGISRSAAYRLVKDGDIKSVRIAGALRVPAAAIVDFAQRITAAA
jgi:excisionase family DNA binding protein